MTQQRFHIDKESPCQACGGSRFFLHTGKCIPCTKRMNATKAAHTMRDMAHEWNTQRCQQNTASESFKGRERIVMAGVHYE